MIAAAFFLYPLSQTKPIPFLLSMPYPSSSSANLLSVRMICSIPRASSLRNRLVVPSLSLLRAIDRVSREEYCRDWKTLHRASLAHLVLESHAEVVRDVEPESHHLFALNALALRAAEVLEAFAVEELVVERARRAAMRGLGGCKRPDPQVSHPSRSHPQAGKSHTFDVAVEIVRVRRGDRLTHLDRVHLGLVLLQVVVLLVRQRTWSPEPGLERVPMERFREAHQC